MIPPDINNKKFQGILTRELGLSPAAIFASRDNLAGTQLFESSLGIVRDGDRGFILIRGSFEVTDDYVMMKTDLPEDFGFHRVQKELEEKGFAPGFTRLVCIAVNVSKVKAGQGWFPEFQIFFIPY